MAGILVFAYSLLAYAIGMGGLTYFILYLGDWEFLPFSINNPAVFITANPISAFSLNLALVTAFALQHSVMARPTFKAWLTRTLPASAERSTYVLLSGAFIFLMAWLWQPIAGHFWYADNPVWHNTLLALQLAGWGVAVIASFQIDHFELFGLRQGWTALNGSSEVRVTGMVVRGFYRFVRHPIQTGALLGLWLTPWMTMTHFCMALLMTLYVFVGLFFEEQNLRASLGEPYEQYRRKVPALIPFLPKHG